MECDTVRAGTNFSECPFMGKKGCTYTGGSCNEIIEDCNGCNRVIEVSGKKYCKTVPDPTSKWKAGACNFASHITREKAMENIHKLNPLKASKRGIR